MSKKTPEEEKAHRRDYLLKNRDKITSRRRQVLRKLRLDILSHYSGGVPKCNCCGENEVNFLTLDHIKNDGYKYRKDHRSSGTQLYYWIRKNKYPDDIQVLCYNCNCSKGFYGICPHNKLKQK